VSLIAHLEDGWQVGGAPIKGEVNWGRELRRHVQELDELVPADQAAVRVKLSDVLFEVGKLSRRMADACAMGERP
jgi:hypothetical protein